MLTVRIERSPYGWNLQLGPGIASPFRTLAQAITAAECVCGDLRRHGEDVKVCIEEVADELRPSDQQMSERLSNLLRKAHAENGRYSG